MRNTLKNKKDISNIFSDGKSLFTKSFIIKYSDIVDDPKVLVVAPITRYKRAVDRNRIKRILREVYNKYTDLNKRNMAIIYISEVNIDIKKVDKDFKNIINKINRCR